MLSAFGFSSGQTAFSYRQSLHNAYTGAQKASNPLPLSTTCKTICKCIASLYVVDIKLQNRPEAVRIFVVRQDLVFLYMWKGQQRK